MYLSIEEFVLLLMMVKAVAWHARVGTLLRSFLRTFVCVCVCVCVRECHRVVAQHVEEGSLVFANRPSPEHGLCWYREQLAVFM